MNRMVERPIPRVGVLALIALALPIWPAGLAAQSGATSLGIFAPPETPAAALLGLEPHVVQRPGITVDFVTALFGATNSLSVLPESYAVAFAPYWLFGSSAKTPFHEFIHDADIGTNIAQSLMISLATTSESDAVAEQDATAVSMGFRFSLLRGDITDETVRDLARSLESAAIGAEAMIDSLVDGNPRYQELEAHLQGVTTPSQAEPITEELERIRAAATDSVTRWINAEPELRDAARSLWAERNGWVVDVAGGAVLEFRDRAFDTGRVSRWGIWLTGGYEARSVSLLGVARFLRNDSPHVEPNALELGGRISLSGAERFALSAEVAWRRYPNSDVIPVPEPTLPTPVPDPGVQRVFDDKWRAVLNVEFAAARGKTVSFAFGQDFDVNLAEDDLIALLRLHVGFGTSRVPP